MTQTNGAAPIPSDEGHPAHIPPKTDVAPEPEQAAKPKRGRKTNETKLKEKVAELTHLRDRAQASADAFEERSKRLTEGLNTAQQQNRLLSDKVQAFENDLADLKAELDEANAALEAEQTRAIEAEAARDATLAALREAMSSFGLGIAAGSKAVPQTPQTAPKGTYTL